MDVANVTATATATAAVEPMSVTAQQIIAQQITYPDPYLVSNPGLAIPYLAVVIVALSLGVAGNLLIIFAICSNRKLHTTGNVFMVNLALADLCVTGVADPMCILGVTHGPRLFDNHPGLCEAIACLCLSACFCAFLSLGLLTLSRYMYICHKDIHMKMFTKQSTVVFCVVVWVTGFLMELPNFLGWGGHFFDYKTMQCIWDRTGSYSYTLLVGVGFILTPLVLMNAAYFRIFLKIRDSKRKIFGYNIPTFGESTTSREQWRETLRSARTIFVVITVFVVCWTPYTIVILVDFKDRAPMAVHLWTTLLAHMHSSVNAVVYSCTNSDLRDIFKRTLAKILPWCKALNTNSSNTTNTSSSVGTGSSGINAKTGVSTVMFSVPMSTGVAPVSR